MRQPDLFREGYGVETTHQPGVFRVLRPANRGGGGYLVNAVTDSCNCAARVRCRHRIGLRALVLATAAALEDAGDVGGAANLLIEWAKVILHRDFVARAKTGGRG